MAEAAMTNLVQSVSRLVIHPANLMSGAENELRELVDDLDSLKAVFREMAKNQKDEGAFREIERQLKETILDVDDGINACLTKAAAARSKKSFLPGAHGHRNRGIETMAFLLPSVVKRRTCSLATQVKHLTDTKVKTVLEAFKAKVLTLAICTPLNLPVTQATKVWSDDLMLGQGFKYQDYAIREDEEYYDFLRDDYNTIFGYLREYKDELDVISIVGMCGLGKTTLAKKVFQDIKYEFPLHIWIHVSLNFNIRDMILNILRKLTGKDMSDLSDPELVNTVRKHLEKERFLLVMDDVCRVEDWKVIKDIFPNSCRRGKVLITSCDNDVGVYANVNRVPHKLRFLKPYESSKLLELMVSREFGAFPHKLGIIRRGIPIRIGELCDGLPLQIVAVGEILVRKLIKSPVFENELDEVYKNVNLFLDNKSKISDVVEPSYNILADDLRECFLYMGVFPEDHEISVWTLIRLWIAEGFVKQKGGQSLEDKAMQNLDDLITKNLVMVGKINSIGEVKTCRVHNMIRRFCVYKAQEQNLFQEIRWSVEGVLEPPLCELQKFRRLCLHSIGETLLSQVPYNPRVRSLLCFNRPFDSLDPSSLSTILDAFNLLKVLAIKLDYLVPQRLTKLIHLRYITLSADDLSVLPEPLSELWNLQTLVVETKKRFITMEANIWRLIWLRDLKTNAVIVLSSKAEGVGGEKLQTLSRLSAESCTKDVCEKTRNLKTLWIQGNLDTLFRNNLLEKLHRLEKLKLVNEIASETALHELPHSISLPRNLKRLTLSKTFLNWKHMSNLAMINTLEVLKLKDNAFSGIYWSAEEYCFPNVLFLHMADTDLVHWEVSSDSFPSLKCLVLKNCENLNEIPFGLAANLEILDIEYLGGSAVDSAIKIHKLKENEKTKKVNPRFRFKLALGPGCYETPIVQAQIKRNVESAYQINAVERLFTKNKKMQWQDQSNIKSKQSMPHA